KKRKLEGPPYYCDFPECDKSFHRSEHLSRHKLNHNPKQIYQCNEPHCDKTFVRNDLLMRHIKRHEKKSIKEKPFKNHLVSVNDIIRQYSNEPSIASTPTTTTKRANLVVDEPPNILNWLFNDDPNLIDNGAEQNKFDNSAENDFMIDINEFQLNNTGQSFFIPDGFENFSPSSISPEEIYDGNIYLCDNLKLQELSELIPNIKNHPDFTRIKIEILIKTYWKFFHPRFPILHKPTFKAIDAPPLLLLAMIILGCKLSQCVDEISSSINEKMNNPSSLALEIATPLRWLLFSSPDFQPPATIYIIQSLLILEFYEKNCSTRQLHERAHLHHGTTIQLLRRLPTLGGTPQKANNGWTSESAKNWYNWIEFESLKRATFMCFYMDAIDGISFGHQMLIYAHQIQMTMPVEDEMWESNLLQFNSRLKKNFKRKPQPYLIALKNILNGQTERTNSLGKKVLVAGLCTLMFQIQQYDIQKSFGLDKFGMNNDNDTLNNNNWRNLLTAAFSIWRNDVGQSCCSSRTAVESVGSVVNSSQFSTSDTRCKCVTYHMAHVYMSIPHYDFTIYAGAPWRMNVKPSSTSERLYICKRVDDWTNTRHAKVCVTQCYLYLFEMFLSPLDGSYEYQYDYSPDHDLFFRSNVLGLCTVVLWTYVYSKYGVEINIHDESINFQNYKGKECGYAYLKRVREEFRLRSNGKNLHTWFSTCSGSEFYGQLMEWVDVLDDIPNLQNLTGLLHMIGNKLVHAEYTVVKEVGKLLLFCGKRSIGFEETILNDMYD
ncbi:hypothetical protein CANARDRAFT_185399, partial [[Candida] arabinofermentans NRRL YB-2248]